MDIGNFHVIQLPTYEYVNILVAGKARLVSSRDYIPSHLLRGNLAGASIGMLNLPIVSMQYWLENISIANLTITNFYRLV